MLKSSRQGELDFYTFTFSVNTEGSTWWRSCVTSLSFSYLFYRKGRFPISLLTRHVWIHKGQVLFRLYVDPWVVVTELISGTRYDRRGYSCRAISFPNILFRFWFFTLSPTENSFWRVFDCTVKPSLGWPTLHPCTGVYRCSLDSLPQR